AQADGEATITTGAFGIAPMNLNAGQVESTLSIRVERENGSGKAEPAGGDFSFRPVLKRVPRAMWGEKLQQDMNGERYVENAPLGMELAPATPPTPGETKWISRGALQFATSLVEGGIGFEPLTN